MAELAPEVIRVVGQQMKSNTADHAAAVAAVTSGQITWVFGDEEVLPTSAQLKANLALYEGLSIPAMSISALLAQVRAWTA